MNISAHNSASELNQTPELLTSLGIEQKSFTFQETLLPYCEKQICPEAPGAPLLLFFLHGHGSVGHDNFLQIRIPARPLIEHLRKLGRKTILIMPQCERNFQWVDVPWSSTSHTLPGQPSKYMSAALALFDAACAAYAPDQTAGIGISMGGYGIWDMACRRHFDILGVMCGGADTASAPQFVNTRICIYHGALDNIVPVCRGRDMAAALKSAGCREFTYRELPENAHNVWDEFFTDDFALHYLLG